MQEDHLSQHVPHGPGDFDRGMHLLVGEPKFRGSDRGEKPTNIFICSLTDASQKQTRGSFR